MMDTGFDIEVSFDTEAVSLNVALDTFIDFVETREWEFGGGGREDAPVFSGFVCHSEDGSISEADLLDMRAWCESQPWIMDFNLSGLIEG